MNAVQICPLFPLIGYINETQIVIRPNENSDNWVLCNNIIDQAMVWFIENKPDLTFNSDDTVTIEYRNANGLRHCPPGYPALIVRAFPESADSEGVIICKKYFVNGELLRPRKGDKPQPVIELFREDGSLYEEHYKIRNFINRIIKYDHGKIINNEKYNNALHHLYSTGAIKHDVSFWELGKRLQI